MAITANGMIAKKDGDSNWVSPEDVKSFTSVCQKAGVVIMGRRTYDLLSPDDLPLNQGAHIILTNNASLRSNNSTVEFTNKNPNEVVDMLVSRGCQLACLIGGQNIVSQFMQQNLVDEIYFDVEPLLFGSGMPIFKDVDSESDLELIDTNKLNDNTVQLHYKVLK